MSESILREAERLIHGERNKNYGHPRDNFADIAALFSAYLGREITDIDVANLMILVKIARVKGTGYHRDSFVDVAGYAGCVERIYEESPKVDALTGLADLPNDPDEWISRHEWESPTGRRYAWFDGHWRYWSPILERWEVSGLRTGPFKRVKP